MVSKYRVEVSARASQMMAEHTAFVARVNVTAARNLVAAFRKAANSLSEMPMRCAWLTAEYIPYNKYRFLVFAERYMLIFQIRDDVVYVDYVLDCRRDYSWLLK